MDLNVVMFVIIGVVVVINFIWLREISSDLSSFKQKVLEKILDVNECCGRGYSLHSTQIADLEKQGNKAHE